MEDEHNTAGSRTPGAPAESSLKEDVAPPPRGRSHDDGPYPTASGMGSPFSSSHHPSPAQYALSNLVDFSNGGRSLGPPRGPPLALTPTYCSSCEKMFVTIEAFSRHEAMHSVSVKLFPCVECGKYYRHNTALVIHRRSHTGEKPYSCAECGKRFSARSSLVTHGKTHTGKKIYRCTECGKSFARTDDLFHHQLTHRDRKFSCEDCGRCFKAEPELLAHRKEHPTEELYLCSGCGRDFTPYSKLLHHQKSHPQPPPAVLITDQP